MSFWKLSLKLITGYLFLFIGMIFLMNAVVAEIPEGNPLAAIQGFGFTNVGEFLIAGVLITISFGLLEGKKIKDELSKKGGVQK